MKVIEISSLTVPTSFQCSGTCNSVVEITTDSLFSVVFLMQY